MRKLFIVTLCVLGITGTAMAAVDAFYPVYLNGKPFGRAILISGNLVGISGNVVGFPLADFAKLGGGTLSLEEVGLTLTGNNTLTISSQVADAYHKHKDVAPVVAGDPAYKPQTPSAYKENQAAAKVNIKGESRVAWKWQRDGVITKNALRYGGGIYIPLSDLARAFGGTFTMPAAGLQPGAAIQLNFTKTPTALLIDWSRQ